jgi:beta-glucosidase
VKGLLDAWYPGERGGSAIARVLFGDVDPSGHLPVTFPASASAYPTAGDPSSYPGIANSETYKEGVFVGYRWYDAHRLAPAFPFGLGLSYTRFAFRGLTVRTTASGAVVQATVANVGGRAGAAVPQLYVGMPASATVPEPPLQLKDAEKVQLAPGRQARVRFVLDSRSLSHWDTAAGAWKVAGGCYRVMVGSSSRDLPLRGAFPRGRAICPGSLQASAR